MRTLLLFSLLASIAFVPLAACGGRTGTDDLPSSVGVPTAVPTSTSSPANAHDPAFAGYWLVDDQKSPHGSFTGSIYKLAPDGTVTLVRTLAGPSPDASRIGLERNTEGVWCVIGGAWHSESSTVLVLDGSCSDGAARPIKLRFANLSVTTVGPVSTSLISVGGETGWNDTTAWGWQWTRCANPAECAP
jgi:hypothetical protein